MDLSLRKLCNYRGPIRLLMMSQNGHQPSALLNLGIKTCSKVCYCVLFTHQHFTKHLSFQL